MIIDGNFTFDIYLPYEDTGYYKTDFDPRIAKELASTDNPVVHSFNLQKIMNNNFQFSDEIIRRYLQEDEDILIPHNKEIKEKLSIIQWFEFQHAFLIKTYNCIYRKEISNELYWNYAYLAWTHHKINFFPPRLYTNLFVAARPNRFRYLMTEEDKELFHALPNKVTVYRGCQEGYEEGWSFTTNYEIAKWFALRKPQFTKPRIVHATVYKKDIIAYFHERYEAEVLAEKHEFNHIEILEHIPDYKMDLMDLVSNLSM